MILTEKSATFRDHALLPRLVEKSQIRRRLILPHRHQIAVSAQEIVLLADDDMLVALGANRLAPDRAFFCIAKVLLDNGPRTRQSIVDDGNFIIKRVRIGLVEIDPLLDDGLVVLVQRKAGAVV